MTNFNAQTEKENVVLWLRNWFNVNGPKATAVIGISGGKDSTVAAALLVEALGSDRVLGVLMPNGTQLDIDDARKVCACLNIKALEVNIKKPYDAMQDALYTAGIHNFTSAMNQNLAPRLRMATLYAVAQALPEGGRVINTCNYSEDYVGYSTKYGDAAGDVSPLGAFTKNEVVAIGKLFKNIPVELIEKAPSDGLCGKTDEDNLGFTYNQLEDYIYKKTSGNENIDKKIERLHNVNLHKLKPIPTYIRQ